MSKIKAAMGIGSLLKDLFRRRRMGDVLGATRFRATPEQIARPRRFYRGDVLPFGTIPRVGGQAYRQTSTGTGAALHGPGLQGVDLTTNLAKARTYADFARYGGGVPVIRSQRYKPGVNLDMDELFSLYPRSYPRNFIPDHIRINPRRGLVPIDRTRTILENLRQLIPDRYDRPLAGIRALIKKIKNPEQREIIKRILIGDTKGLRTGGQV